MPAPADKAVEVFKQEFNCAQSVLVAFAARLGLDEPAAFKLASPFGAGLARRGEVCGAVTGGLMALGLARGTDTPASKEQMYALAQEFMRRFEAAHGSILCRTLIDCDLTTPAGRQEAARRGVSKNICPGLVRSAAELVEEMLRSA